MHIIAEKLKQINMLSRGTMLTPEELADIEREMDLLNKALAPSKIYTRTSMKVLDLRNEEQEKEFLRSLKEHGI